jgi:hypothetical protein
MTVPVTIVLTLPDGLSTTALLQVLEDFKGAFIARFGHYQPVIDIQDALWKTEDA